MKRGQKLELQQSQPSGLRAGSVSSHRAMRRSTRLLLIPALAIVLSGCSHLRPPDDYAWKDESGDPGGLDRATAAQWDFQDTVSEDANRKAMRDFMNNLPQAPRTP